MGNAPQLLFIIFNHFFRLHSQKNLGLGQSRPLRDLSQKCRTEDEEWLIKRLHVCKKCMHVCRWRSGWAQGDCSLVSCSAVDVNSLDLQQTGTQSLQSAANQPVSHTHCYHQHNVHPAGPLSMYISASFTSLLLPSVAASLMNAVVFWATCQAKRKGFSPGDWG